jgi:hypothetical protein
MGPVGVSPGGITVSKVLSEPGDVVLPAFILQQQRPVAQDRALASTKRLSINVPCVMTTVISTLQQSLVLQHMHTTPGKAILTAQY